MPFIGQAGAGGGMGGMGAGPGMPAAPSGGNPTTQSAYAVTLKAGMPPTTDEITRKQQELADKLKKDYTLYGGTGNVVNQQQVDDMVKQQTADLPKQIMQDVATSSRVYINPGTFEVNPQIVAAAGAPDALTIYLAQLGYWIQYDVVNAINEINGASKSVPESVVKNLISVRVDAGGIPRFIAAAGATTANDDPDGQLKKDNTVSATGRVSNGLYDVFHFTINADVQADKLPEFLRGLSNKRFITPLGVDLRAVDNAQALAQGHVYGDKPVVNVTVPCEILYFRKWNAPLMPAAVKTQLGITDQAPGAAPAAPAAQQAAAAVP